MKTFSNFNSKSDCETWVMISASKWFDKSFESIWNSKILKQIDRDEKIFQRSEFLINVASRFYQTFEIDKDICILMTNANLCEISEIENIAVDKKTVLQSVRAFECNESVNVNVSH